jgi:hypothetical protein
VLVWLCSVLEVKMKKHPFSIKLKFHNLLTPLAGPAHPCFDQASLLY